MPASKPRCIFLCPEVIIDTKYTSAPKESKRTRISRNKGLRKYWNYMALSDSLKGCNVKYLTNEYINYLGEKMRELFYKYATNKWPIKPEGLEYFPNIPNVCTLLNLFRSKQMNDFIQMYYQIVHSDMGEKKDVNPENEWDNVRALFQMLEKEFSDTHKMPLFSQVVVPDYTQE